MDYKCIDKLSYKLHEIKTDKFKTFVIAIMFYNQISKETITNRIFLSDLMSYSTKKYPSRRSLGIKKEELYDTSYSISDSRVGNLAIKELSYTFMDPKYAKNDFLEDAIAFVGETLNNPNVSNKEFDKDTVSLVRKRLLSDIKTNDDRPRYKALSNALELTDSKNVINIKLCGYKEEVETVTSKDLYKAYTDMLEHDICDVFVVGDIDFKKLEKLLDKYLIIKSIKNKELTLYNSLSVAKKVKEKVDINEAFTQSQLIVTLNAVDLTEEERKCIAYMYNSLLGGSSINSLLGTKLREENSLCYSVSSSFNKYDNLFVITSGISRKNKDLAVKLIKECLNKLKKGDFETELFEDVKRTIIESIKMSSDSKYTIISRYFFNYIAGSYLPDELIKAYSKVTKEDVVALASKVKLNTVYLLGGSNENN